MPTAENARLEYEAGQTSVPMSALTDSGDQTIFTSTSTLWTRRSGYAPVVCVDGVVTGGAVTPATAGGTDDVDVAALTCNLAGVLTSVSAAADTEITRPATNVAKVNSITVNSGGAIAVVAGTDGSDTTFSETRGAAGGPPYVPVGSIEVAQVRVTSSSAAVITAAEILDVDGLHKELAISPTYTISYSAGTVTFASALPAFHTGDLPRAVYASYASPIFASVTLASDYVPSENSHQVTSTQIYGRTLGASSTTLNAGTFTAYLEDGVNDPLVTLKDEILWFKFYPDRFNTAYILDQGKLGIAREFPADDNITASCTISAESNADEYAA